MCQQNYMKDSYQNQIVNQVWKIIDVICYFMVVYLGYLAVIALNLFFYKVNDSASNTVAVICQMLIVCQPGDILIYRFMNLHS